MKNLTLSFWISITIGTSGLAQAASLLEELLPYQKWSALGSHARGLLVEEQVLGIPTISPALTVGPISERTSSRFGPFVYVQEDDSPVSLYFPSRGEGSNFLEDWIVPGVEGYKVSAAMFNRKTQNSWGLNKEAQIVELEVNERRGTSGDIHFVATSAKVLDVDRRLKPAEKLKAFLAPYANPHSRKLLKLLTTLRKRVAQAEASDPLFEDVKNDQMKTEVHRAFSATWSEKNSELRLMLYLKSSQIFHRRLPVLTRDCTGGTSSTTYGAEFVEIVSFNANGDLIGRNEMIRPFKLGPTSDQMRCPVYDPIRPPGNVLPPPVRN